MGRIPFGFGPRFFVVVLLGFLWLVPAWWSPRLVAAMILWDVVALIVFGIDLVGMPKPREMEVRRAWEHAPSLATRSEVALGVRNLGNSAVRCTLVDETPLSFRSAPPSLSVVVNAKHSATVKYEILPRQRGDVRLGTVFLRYQSKWGFAERWTAIDIPQTVRVLPDLEQARQQALYLIRSRQVEMEKRRRRQRGQGREF